MHPILSVVALLVVLLLGVAHAGEGSLRRGFKRLGERRRASREAAERHMETMRYGWYQVVLVFLAGSVFGLLIEEAWMVVSVGLVENRAGLVWGPFSPVYGICAVCLTTLGFYLRRLGARPWQTFLASAVTGGLLEQVTGWLMSEFINAESWTYVYLPDRITPWVAWRFLLAWGLIGLWWCRVVTPRLLHLVGEPRARWQRALVWALTLVLSVDAGVTVACLVRRAERLEGIPAANAFEEWIDESFPDEFIAERFENLRFGEEREPLDENGNPLLTEEEAIERARRIRDGEFDPKEDPHV